MTTDVFISTSRGRRFYPLSPRREDLDIRDIAHALSNICRFTGHVRKFYSVAEHCVRAAWVARRNGWTNPTLRRILLHDASEAYLTDIARPVKYSPMMCGYREAEATLEAMIYERYDCGGNDETVKVYDNVMFVTEARDLMRGFGSDWKHYAMLDRALPHRIRPWSPREARIRFLRAAKEYGVT